jgi:hypothetical protein
MIMQRTKNHIAIILSQLVFAIAFNTYAQPGGGGPPDPGPPTAPVKWINLTGVTESGDILTKVGSPGYGAGANSAEVVQPESRVVIMFETISGSGNNYIIGFSTSESHFDPLAIRYGLRLAGDGSLDLVESSEPISFGSWQPGDHFKIEKNGSNVIYSRNGTMLRTIAVDPSARYRIKSIVYSGNSPVVEASAGVDIVVVPTITPVNANGTGGGIALNLLHGIPPYTYLWSSGEQGPAISNKAVGEYAVNIRDSHFRNKTVGFHIGYKSIWTNLLGITENNGQLTKTGSSGYGDGGANSSNILRANTDGWMEFVSSAEVDNNYILGFASNVSSFMPSDIKYGLSLNSYGRLYYTESNSPVEFGQWLSGDVFRISREGNLMKYYQNGTLIRSVTIDPVAEYRLKAVLYSGTSPSVVTSFDRVISVNGTVTPANNNGTGGAVQISASGGVAPYSYSWSSGEQSADISNKNIGTYTITVTDAEGHASAVPYHIGYKTFWGSIVGATDNNGVLTRTGADGWDAGANSVNALGSGANGWLEFTASPGVANNYIIGYAANAGSFTPSAIKYGLNLSSDGRLYLVESNPGTPIGAWQEGDVFQISRDGTAMRYYRNGMVIQSTTINPSEELKVKSALYSGTSPAVVTSSPSNYSIDWIDAAGVQIDAGVLTKNIPAAAWTNAGATSSNTLPPNTDGWIEFTVTTQRTFIIGFVTTSIFNDNNFANAIYIRSTAQISVYEGSANTNHGNVISGDVFRISREGAEMKYYKNGSVIKTVVVNPATELRARTLIYFSSNSAPVITSSFDASLIFKAGVIAPGGTTSAGSVSVNVVGGASPYNYNWSSGEQTNNISNKASGEYTLTVTDAAGRIKSRTYDLGYKLHWLDLTGVTQNNGVLTKNTPQQWGNAGGESVNILTANTNGWLEFIVDHASNNYITGFSITNGLVYSDFVSAFSINTATGLYGSYEGATFTLLGNCDKGDIFRISREGSAMKYYKNGVMVRSIAADPALDLTVKASIHSVNNVTPSIQTSFDSRIITSPIVNGVNSAGNSGSIAANPVTGTAPYTYLWSTGEQTSSITGKTPGVYNVSITDAEGRSINKGFNLGYKLTWAEVAGVSASNDRLTKTAAAGWGNAGGNSSNILLANTDGWFEFTADNAHSYLIGFALNSGLNYADFTNAFTVNTPGGTYGTWEGSTHTPLGTWLPGDVFKISREGAQVKYYRNGNIVRTVTVDPAIELRVKTTIHIPANTSPLVTTSIPVDLKLEAIVTGANGMNDSGALTLTASGGVQNYTYNWTSGDQTSTLSNKPVGPYTVTVTDTDGWSKSREYYIGHKMLLIDLVNVNEVNGIVSKTAGGSAWNAGANSANLLAANTDGLLEFVIRNETSIFYMGFSANSSDYNNNSFTNAFYIHSNGNVNVMEGPTLTLVGKWKRGDVFRISREGGETRYYHNGVVVRTVTANANALRVKTAIYSGSAPLATTSFGAQLSLRATVNAADGTSGDGSINLTVSGGTEPYTYNWSSGEQTASVSNKPQGSYTVTVTDAEGRQATRTYAIGYKIYWRDHTGVSETGGNIVKPGSGAWNAGVISTNILTAGSNGAVEFATKLENSSYIIGFSTNDSDFRYDTFRNGIYINSNGIVYSFELGTTVALGSWQPGDIFRISREGSSVNYYWNGTLVRTVVAVTSILTVKTSVYSGSAPLASASFDTNLHFVPSVIGTGAGNDGAISLNVIGGKTPYTFAWSGSEQTGSITSQPNYESTPGTLFSNGYRRHRPTEKSTIHHWIQTVLDQSS